MAERRTDGQTDRLCHNKCRTPLRCAAKNMDRERGRSMMATPMLVVLFFYDPVLIVNCSVCLSTLSSLSPWRAQISTIFVFLYRPARASGQSFSRNSLFAILSVVRFVRLFTVLKLLHTCAISTRAHLLLRWPPNTAQL